MVSAIDVNVSITEKPSLDFTNRLRPNRISLGSKEDLVITTKISLLDNKYDCNIEKLFEYNNIASPQIKINKVNYEPTLSSTINVSSFADTSSLITVLDNNTLILSFDSSILQNRSDVLAGNFGPLTGNYAIQAKYTFLNEIILSPWMHFIVY